MGNLIDLNSQISDNRIPSGIARDAEITAAINDHVAVTDPHPGYLTQPEGDARYRQTLTKLIPNQISASTQGGSVNIPHGLDTNKIVAVVGRIEITGGQMVFSNSTMPNAEFYVWVGSTQIVVTNIAGASSFLLSKPLTLLITYTP